MKTIKLCRSIVLMILLLSFINCTTSNNQVQNNEEVLESILDTTKELKDVKKEIIVQQDSLEEKYKKITGNYIIGTDFYNKYLILQYLGNKKFSFKISAASCDISGIFEINKDNVGIFKDKICGEISFDLNEILEWIDEMSGDPRNHPINVSVAKERENCFVCEMKNNEGATIIDFDPWGEYWRDID